MAVGVRIEAVVADLDGTLVAQDFSISAATVDALSELRAAGISLVIATGRAPIHCSEFATLMRYADITVCCSGAIGCVGARRIWQTCLSHAAVSQVVKTAEEYGAGIAGFDGAQWHATDRYRRLNPDIDGAVQRAAVTACALSSMRCVAMAVIHTRCVLTDITRALAGEVRTGLSQVAGRPLVDVTSLLVDKGTGVLRALNTLGVKPAAAVSFGDMPNDIPMFAITGRSYAVGRGDPAVAAVVCETLDPVEQDGFARKIFDLAASDWRLP